MYGVTGVAGVKYSSATRDEEGGGKSTFVADDGGTFTTHYFPWLLLGNPADAFRIYNLAVSDATAAAAGLTGAANSIPAVHALISILVWPVIATVLAWLTFRRVTP